MDVSFFHYMILAKKRLDRRNLVLRDDEGCFQIRAQPQQRDPPRVQFVVVDIADIGVLIGVGGTMGLRTNTSNPASLSR